MALRTGNVVLNSPPELRGLLPQIKLAGPRSGRLVGFTPRHVVLFSSVSGTYTADEEINQASTGAVGKVIEYDSTNLILYYYQTRFPDVGTDTNGNLTAFSGANAITGQSSSASATPDTSNSSTVNGVGFSSGYANPELAYDSGDIIYVEERSPITRASDQTENVKLIIEF